MIFIETTFRFNSPFILLLHQTKGTILHLIFNGALYKFTVFKFLITSDSLIGHLTTKYR